MPPIAAGSAHRVDLVLGDWVDSLLRGVVGEVDALADVVLEVGSGLPQEGLLLFRDALKRVDSLLGAVGLRGTD
jgi:phage tail protein X